MQDQNSPLIPFGSLCPWRPHFNSRRRQSPFMHIIRLRNRVSTCPTLPCSPVQRKPGEQVTHHHIRHPLFKLECKSEAATLTLRSSSRMKASTSHSYHTFLSSVCRHMVISISELSGTYNGVYSYVSAGTSFQMKGRPQKRWMTYLKRIENRKPTDHILAFRLHHERIRT